MQCYSRRVTGLLNDGSLGFGVVTAPRQSSVFSIGVRFSRMSERNSWAMKKAACVRHR